jgi:hypothetical protein
MPRRIHRRIDGDLADELRHEYDSVTEFPHQW